MWALSDRLKDPLCNSTVERRFCEFKQWWGVATRFDKLPVVFRAGVMCKAMVTWLKHLSNTP